MRTCFATATLLKLCLGNFSPGGRLCIAVVPVSEVEIIFGAQLTWASRLVHPFDARGVGKRFRHAAISGALASLLAGEVKRFVNDFLQQIEHHLGDRIQISYRRRDLGEIIIDFLAPY